MTGLEGLLPIILIGVLFWFLLIRPQRRRQIDLVNTQRSVGVGDQVMLGAGILGTVTDADPDFVDLEVSPGVRIRVARGAVARILTPGPEADDDLNDLDDLDEPGPDTPPRRDT